VAALVLQIDLVSPATGREGIQTFQIHAPQITPQALSAEANANSDRAESAGRKLESACKAPSNL
jgi:hypothetical protein